MQGRPSISPRTSVFNLLKELIMSNKTIESNPILDLALNWEFPKYDIETGIKKVVAFGDQSHKCPVYLRQEPPCNDGCPAGNDIRAWLTTVQHTELKKRTPEESYRLLWKEVSKTQPLPAVCGRVCPHPCEPPCNRNQKEGAININAYERWIGDYAIQNGLDHEKLTDEVQPQKVAVIGSGPAGLSCAFQLARRGYPVTIFESFEKPGGMLRYGIPPYRLPRDIIDAEIAAIERMGVEIRCNTVVGEDTSLDDLKQEFDAVYMAIGAHKGIGLGLDGEDAPNVFSGVEFLNKVNSGEMVDVGEEVVVIGGGDTAIDAARVSLRLSSVSAEKGVLDSARVSKRMGAKVTILYRRTREEMPAIDPEVDEALEENIDIQFLTAPVGILTENGKAVAVKCLRMELGEPDESGRRRPVPIEGSEFEVPCSALIPAVSQEPEWRDAERYVSGKDWFKPGNDWSVDDKVFVGGDAVKLGLACNAIGNGRKAAENIHMMFTGEKPPKKERKITASSELNLEYYDPESRSEREYLTPETRLKGGLDLEIDQGISEEQFQNEAKRCMSCGLCFECYECMMYCPQVAITRFTENPAGEVMFTEYNKCVGCHLCAEICPCNYIQMGMSDEL
jgi:NADPH-dependent glutamate synthase beta subunit-like oxidoreductase/Pyruvate/2-oxoacid:ferredoxin oxidoreductase delta subunit